MSLKEQYKILNGDEVEQIDEELQSFGFRVNIVGDADELSQIENYLKQVKDRFKGIQHINIHKII